MVIFVRGRIVQLMLDGLDYRLFDLEMPAFFAGRAVNRVKISIDGRQKSEVFYFPILQTPRRLRRGQSSPGKETGQLSMRNWCSNGLSRSQSCEGARIVRDVYIIKGGFLLFLRGQRVSAVVLRSCAGMMDRRLRGGCDEIFDGLPVFEGGGFVGGMADMSSLIVVEDMSGYRGMLWR